MGLEDAVLADARNEIPFVKCLIFEENIGKPYNGILCLCRALALNLHGNEKLEEETSKMFKLQTPKENNW